ncbi:MAG TPA: MFS transporter [Thermoplasmataceae archaeon]|nr:MFS transporter [Thermoplasmataceae archaeon]
MRVFSRIRGFELLGNNAVRAISAAQLLRILGRSQAWIFVPVYLTQIRGLPYIFVGLLFFITAIISLPFSLYGGNLIDRIGRRKIGKILPPVISSLLFILAASAYFDLQLLIVVVAFLLIEPFTSVQGILDNVIITDSTIESSRNDAFSIVRIFGNIGFSAGPAIGGYLAYVNFALIFTVPAVLTLFEWYFYLRYIHDIKRITPALSGGMFKFPSNDRYFLLISTLISVSFLVTGQWGTTLTLFWSGVDHITNRFIGTLYAVNGLVVVFFQVPINYLFLHLRDRHRISIAVLMYAFGFFALAFSTNSIFLILDVVLLTIGENTISPVIYGLVSKIAPEDRRGQYFGAFQLMNGLVTPVAPVLGTTLIQYFSFNPVIVWLPILILGIVSSVFITAFGKERNRTGIVPQ